MRALLLAFFSLSFAVGCGDPTPMFDKKEVVAGVEFTFKAGHPIYKYKNGRVASGVLSGDHEVEGNHWKMHLQDLCRVWFFDDGTLSEVGLSGNHKIDHRGEDYSVYHAVEFFPSGAVQLFYVSSETPIQIDNTAYVFKERTPIGFYEDGQVAYGTTTQDGFARFLGGRRIDADY